MDLIGKQVKHSKFGDGVIVAQEVTTVTVKFSSELEAKKFIYPACFKTFLKLVDAETAAQADKTVMQHEEQERKKKQHESEMAEAKHFAKRTQEESSKSNKAVVLRPFNSVEAFCSEYKKATKSEIVYLKSTGGKRQHVFDGKRIEYKNSRYVYTFEADDELKYPEGTQISIWQGETSMSGSIVGCEDFTVIIATSTDLGIDVPYLEFSAEPWRLLNHLVDRLDSILDDPSEIVRELICDGYKAIEHTNHKITTGQQTAVQMAKSQPITFVWGPPGTGKTQTLAKIALEHINNGHRVLMLSYSNVSVDGAVLRVHKLQPNLRPGTIVRYGYARQAELLDHKFLTAYNLAIHNHPELLKERKELIAERKKLPRTSKRYVEIGRRLNQIKNALSSEEKEALKNARFVATTVSKTVVDSAVRECDFDVVIFDEASMAYIPQIIYAASLANKHFICMGDFRQLPPIVQGNSTSPLNADIFQYCGITAAVDSGRNHKWLCMLDTQYRMHPHIADFSSRTMYGGLLRSANEMSESRQPIVANEPVAGHDSIEGSYDSSIFTAEKSALTMDKAYRAQKAIQDYVFTDGSAEKSVERKFAESLDGAEEVFIYAKLPKGFYIPTPVGHYSPDWAIVFHEGKVKHIYFVAETKGTMESLNLRPIEKAKIDCAKKLFSKLSGGLVTYDHVDSYQELLNKVMK